MLNATIEMFMSEYFLIKAIIGKYLTDSKALFGALSRICLIPTSEVDKLYDLAENDTAKSITSEKEFMQYQRMQKYSAMVGVTQNSNAEWDEVIRIKGNAIIIARSYNLVPDAEASRNVVHTYLSSAATSGTVCALRIMGFLQYEGIFFDKNEKAGLKNLSKAADWNDSLSILAQLLYCKEKRERNMARLRQVIEGKPFSEIYKEAEKRYCTAADMDVGEVMLLNKAFSSGALKCEIYEPKYSRILNSKMLYFKDKEKAVFSPNKEQLSVIGDLPLKLTPENIAEVDADAVQKVAIKRETEIAAVIRALKNSDLRELPSYRPLCLCSDSKYLLNMYAKVIASNNNATHVEMIDVAELIDYDFEPTPNNIFVRSIDEDKDNRFFLFFCGDVQQRKMDAVKSILQSNKRAKFHLNNPSVTLNLGAILPICFCDSQNVEQLKPYCDIVKLATVTTNELPLAVKDIFVSKVKLYGLGAIKLNGKECEVFGGCDVDTIEKLVDSAVRARREKGAEIVLSRDILREYMPDDNRPRIGFGGITHERNY